jgi:hypothetical protein
MSNSDLTSSDGLRKLDSALRKGHIRKLILLANGLEKAERSDGQCIGGRLCTLTKYSDPIVGADLSRPQPIYRPWVV